MNIENEALRGLVNIVIAFVVFGTCLKLAIWGAKISKECQK